MAVSLSPIGGVAAQFFDNNGNPLAGGKLYSYEAGTTTPQTTYTTIVGTTANTNPIILNAAGRVPGEVWLTSNSSYKFVLTDSVGNLLGTWDNIYGYSSGSVAYAATETQTATADQSVFVLTEMQYSVGTNTLAVYVDGVNQVVNNAYVESGPNTVTFVSGLHVGALVKFVNITSASVDASVVFYTPAGTGAVATTVQAKLRESVSVKDFGAVGDGVTDDGPAFMLALQAADVVIAPEAVYNIDTSIEGVFSNKRLVGKGATLKTTQTSNFEIIKFANGEDNNEVTGFTFLGVGVTDTATPVIGIDVYQSDFNYIHGNTFSGLNHSIRLIDLVAFDATNPRGNKIVENTFLDAVGPTNGGYGVLSVRTVGTIISGNVFGNGNAGDFGRHCIYVSAGSRETTVTDNYTANSVLSPITINSGTTAGDEITGLLCTGNTIYGSGLTTANSYGITVTGALQNSIISSNTISYSCKAGIFMQSANATMYPNNNIINGNRVRQSGDGGIEIIDVEYCQFTNNQVSNSNVNNTAIRDVTLTTSLLSSLTGNVISGNSILDATNAVRNNIYLGANTTGNIVQGNLTSGATQTPIEDAGTNFTTPVSNGVQTVVYAASITPDPAAGEIVKVTLTGDLTIANVTWAQVGSKLTFILSQDGTGSHSVTWGSLYDAVNTWSDTGNTANRVSTISFQYDGTKWRQLGAQVDWHD